ncbi:MAG: DUF2061 domain-containing protein [Verrucomicrobia bacterium]|nr:MAG: DUF2061 domain-containing protein [Verrucomicrobiota bacterium]
MESHKRSLTKAVSWRFFALLQTTLAAWLISGSVKTGFLIGGLDFAIKIGTYYFHERLWLKLRWGLVDTTVVKEGEGI